MEEVVVDLAPLVVLDGWWRLVICIHHGISEDGDVVELLDHGVHVAGRSEILEPCKAVFGAHRRTGIILFALWFLHLHNEVGPVVAQNTVEFIIIEEVLHHKKEQMICGLTGIVVVTLIPRCLVKDDKILFFFDMS